jgi:pimeloyl-ACP methyl ester carboxylesterase
MQHGIFDSSDSWVANKESKSLAFVLANLGYDVWLGNNRGNKYSRNHISLNPNTNDVFWNFSFHEMGKYDLPAMIDFIRRKTGKSKISYVGHSQGTTQLFSALTYNTEFMTSRINSFAALGPVTNLENVASGFVKFMADYKIDILLQSRNVHELFNNQDAVAKFQNVICKYAKFFCTGVLDMISDKNPKYNDMDRFQVWLNHYPSGSSSRSVQHLAESVRSKTFAPLDSKAEPYNIKNIKGIPIGLFVGNQDLLATIKDNRNLKAALYSNDVIKFYKEYENFGHSSFFISEANPHLQDLINFLEKFNQ